MKKGKDIKKKVGNQELSNICAGLGVVGDVPAAFCQSDDTDSTVFTLTFVWFASNGEKPKSVG